jgi:hypothetical protein
VLKIAKDNGKRGNNSEEKSLLSSAVTTIWVVTKAHVFEAEGLVF